MGMQEMSQRLERTEEMTKYELEKTYKVWDTYERAYLEIGEDSEIDQFIQLRTPNERSRTYYGDILLSLSVEHAERLIQALQCAVKDQKAKEI